MNKWSRCYFISSVSITCVRKIGTYIKRQVKMCDSLWCCLPMMCLYVSLLSRWDCRERSDQTGLTKKLKTLKTEKKWFAKKREKITSELRLKIKTTQTGWSGRKTAGISYNVCDNRQRGGIFERGNNLLSEWMSVQWGPDRTQVTDRENERKGDIESRRKEKYRGRLWRKNRIHKRGDKPRARYYMRGEMKRQTAAWPFRFLS